MIRKKNNIKTIIIVIVTLILVGLIIFFVGRSYGFFQYVKKGETTNVVSIKGIKINVIEDDNALNLENAEPLYDKDGMELKAFKFSMTNTSSRPIEYTLKVVNDTDKQEACVLDEGTENEQTCSVLTTDNLKFAYKLNDEEYSSPSNLGESNDVVTTYIINGKETLTYEIKIWIKSDATNEIMNHYFFGQLLIQGQQADHERIEYETLAPGLYDSNYRMLASWDTLVNDYGLDVEKDYVEEDMKSNEEEVASYEELVYENINSTSLDYILKNNEELKNGKILVLGDEVTRIGAGSMLSQDLEEVVISSGVTEIGECAFMTDHNLKSVVFKENSQLTTIGAIAFELTGLNSIELPSSLTTINQEAFVYTNIRKIEIPSTVTTIGNYAFMGIAVLIYDGPAEDTENNNWGAASRSKPDEYGFVYADKAKTKLTGYVGDNKNVVIPSGIVEIGQYAFQKTGIESIYIPATVTKIGHMAFQGLKTLKRVEFEDSMTMEEVGVNAFDNTGLQSIEQPLNATIYDSFGGIPTLYSYKLHEGNQNLYGAISLGQYVDGDFVYLNENKKILVDYIGTDKVVNVPSSVEYIHNYGAFMINGSTKIVNVPSTVKGISTYAFYGIPVVNYTGTATGNWVNRTLNPYIEGDFAYSDSTKTTLLAYIGDSTDVVVPSTVTSIGRYAFVQYYSNLEGIKYKKEEIKTRRTERVTVPDTVTNIHEEAFANVNIVVYNGSVEDTNNNNWKANYRNPYIEGNFAYSDSTKTKLVGYFGTDTTITIPTGVTVIGNNAFQDTKVENVTLPNSITKLEDWAFENSNLESINIPSSLTELGIGALGGTNISSMNIPATVTAMGPSALYDMNYINYQGSAEDKGNNNWGAIVRNPYIEGDLAYTDSTKTTLARYIGNSTNVTIPSTVTTIGKNAFNHSKVEIVTLPEGLTTIDNYAFRYSNLKSINLPSTLTSIGTMAFKETKLESITIPSAVNYIGYSVFANSTISSITFENPNGWKYKRYNSESGTDLKDLKNNVKATIYLKYKYSSDSEYIWTRSDD